MCYPATINEGRWEKEEGRRTIILEIGPGRGDFLFHLAETNPHAEIIGVELKSQRYFKLIERIIKRGFKNVKVIQADGRYLVANDLAPETIDEIHINFPDPWPKRKHTKNRLMSKEFLECCARVLKKDGLISFITDSKDYADEVAKEKGDRLIFTFEKVACPLFLTYFAQKWLKEGRKFYKLTWRKI